MGKKVKISISIDFPLLEYLDRKKGLISRSKFISKLIEEGLNAKSKHIK